MNSDLTQQEREQYAYTAVRDIKNPFYPNHPDPVSLNQVHLYVIHGFDVDRLPSDVRTAYDKALPYLEKRFHRG